eukprot:CAMPEP_0196142624 /NCGR_PEP_ID=MMETSP0910-20130528/11936_1 /TAXON_ID=49265 /ORGANISM="Thalassiosira rotula, Strain GSO102" /LENGTH=381 /DNA_ID=CAMNT_0041403963 /DNA_START=44 /DNA_END=1189 /DNA_ORIENTATION=+
MRTTPSFPLQNKVNSTTLPLLLLTFLSLSSAWAGAFNSGISSPLVHQRRTTSHASFVDGPSPPMKPSPSTRNVDSPSSFLSLSTLLFLRGGQQDEKSVISDESVKLEMQDQQYGTQDTEPSSPEVISDDTEPSSPDADEGSASAGIEITSKSSSPLIDVWESIEDESSPKKSPLVLSAVLAPVSSLLRSAAAFYTKQLTSRPIMTKSLTAAIVFGLSDWCAQLIELGESEEGADDDVASSESGKVVFSRILTSFLVGLLFFGPAANAWYSMIFQVLPSTSLVSTLQKAALGQIFFGPTFTCVFFGAGMIQSGSFSLGAWFTKVREDLPAVWASGLGYWPLVDFISYKVVPVQWIPLFVNFCSFVWTIYLSLVANRGKAVEE